MTLDLWILAALAASAAHGAWTGAIRQISHWIGLIAACLAAKPLAATLAPQAAARLHWPPHAAAIALTAVLFPILIVAVTVAARALIDALVPGRERNAADRVAGFALGAGKAGALAWAALSVALAFEAPLAKASPRAEAALQASRAAAFTRTHGLFGASLPPALAQLRALAAGTLDPAQAKALLDQPALKELLADPALKSALLHGDPAALLRDPRVRKLLSDPALARELSAPAPR